MNNTSRSSRIENLCIIRVGRVENLWMIKIRVDPVGWRVFE